ncbi:MAG: hypothetical protein GF320_13800 [Armatimonadia bacterium]|nr:hypothetical protein [Armatimonadia bacterium]
MRVAGICLGASLTACLPLLVATPGCGGAAAPAPVLTVSPAQADFPVGTDTLTLQIRDETADGDSTLTWSLAEDPEVAWLTADTETGEGEGDVTLTVDRTGLDNGTLTTDLSITSSGGSVAVPVEMVVPPGDANVVISSEEVGRDG